MLNKEELAELDVLLEFKSTCCGVCSNSEKILLYLTLFDFKKSTKLLKLSSPFLYITYKVSFSFVALITFFNFKCR